MTNILITGGAGFIGCHLVRRLHELGGYNITVLDDESAGNRQALSGFTHRFILGDIRNEAVLTEALRGQQIVIHLAAEAHVRHAITNPAHCFDVNVRGTFQLLMHARDAGVEYIINASTGGAITGQGEPPVSEESPAQVLSPYGASKLAMEGFCDAFSASYGMKITSLRFSNIYGEHSWHKNNVVDIFFRKLLAGEELVVYGDGTQCRDFLYVGDLVDGILAVMKRGKSNLYQLGSRQPTSLNELLHLIQKTVGPNFPLQVKYATAIPGEIKDNWCDISKAERELGFHPTTSFPEGLAKTWIWFLNAKDI